MAESLVLLAGRTVVLLAVASQVGGLFRQIHLPQISGYLFVGVLGGPHGASLLSDEHTRRLWPVDNLCLAVIGIAAGCELHLASLRTAAFRSSVLQVTTAVTLCTWTFIFPTVLFLGPHIGFLRDAPPSHLLAVASLTATLGIARSPASMIAVLRELEARGPFCNLVMSVTVVKDVLVLLLFAVNLEVVGALLEASSTPPSPSSRLVGVLLSCVLAPLLKVLLSLLLGAGGGVVLGTLQLRGGEDRSLHPATILLLAAALFLGSRTLPAEPLLVCVTAGAVAANRREERGEAQREELHALLGGLMPPINLCFFCLAGASLGVDALVGTAPIALIIHAVRLLSLICATHASSFGLPRELRRCVWMAMVTQAGVALGLARTVLARFPQWGDQFYGLMVATVLVNQVVGPPLFRAALVAVGEHKGGRGLPVDAASHSADAAS